MALRIVRKVDDPILLKKAREVKKIDDRLLQLLDDMVDTMHEENGIGLAGPQVGILRRVFVADLGDGNVYKIINPEILESEGEDIDIEGCLSIPNFNCTVKRAEKIKMKYMDIEGNEQIIETDGMLAKCFQHERDHLDGILITSKMIDKVTDENYEEILKKIGKEYRLEESEEEEDEEEK